MGADDGAGALAEAGDDAVLDAEVVEEDGRADDVRDGVERADLVEVDLIEGTPVGLGLGLGNDAEGPQGDVAGAVGHRQVAEDVLHVGQAPMVVMVMFALVVMMLGEMDVEVAPGQAMRGLAGDVVGEALGGEGREGGVELGAVGAEVEERGDGHVAADAAGAVKIEQGRHGGPFDWQGGGYGRP